MEMDTEDTNETTPTRPLTMIVESNERYVFVSIDGTQIIFPVEAMGMVAETLTHVERCGPFIGSMRFDFVADGVDA